MKYNFVFSMKVILGALILIMGTLSVLLVRGHSHLHQQMNRVMTLQGEYQTYTLALQKILREYQQVKEHDSLVSMMNIDEKKKEVSFQEQPFLVVNREPDYLKESLEEYVKEKQLGGILERINSYDEHGNKISKSRRRRKRWKNSSLLARQLGTKKLSNVNRDILLAWPINRSKFWISSFYGVRRNPNRTWGFHSGIDMAALRGTSVNAAYPGVVVEAGTNKGYGNTIVIMHNKKYKTRYAHLKQICCKLGDKVKQGQLIALVGDTGLVRKKGRSASHLHFELYARGKHVNPLYYLV